MDPPPPRPADSPQRPFRQNARFTDGGRVLAIFLGGSVTLNIAIDSGITTFVPGPQEVEVGDNHVQGAQRQDATEQNRVGTSDHIRGMSGWGAPHPATHPATHPANHPSHSELNPVTSPNERGRRPLRDAEYAWSPLNSPDQPHDVGPPQGSSDSLRFPSQALSVVRTLSALHTDVSDPDEDTPYVYTSDVEDTMAYLRSGAPQINRRTGRFPISYTISRLEERCPFCGKTAFRPLRKLFRPRFSSDQFLP